MPFITSSTMFNIAALQNAVTANTTSLRCNLLSNTGIQVSVPGHTVGNLRACPNQTSLTRLFRNMASIMCIPPLTLFHRPMPTSSESEAPKMPGHI